MPFKSNRITRKTLQLTVFFIVGIQCGAFAASCVTTANETWDCGTPIPSDDLIVNHTVTISDNFDLTGSITVNNGGHLTISGNVNATVSDITVNLGGTLTIDGNVIISANCNFTIYGDVVFNNSFTIQNTAAFIVSGTINVKGKVLVEQGASLVIQSNATLTTDNDFESNSNDVTIDGIVNVDGDFTNNKKITGIGQINYTNSCQGDGTINGYMSEEYCGTSPIELSILDCSFTDTIDPEFTSFPSDQTIYVTQNDCDISVSWPLPTAADNCVVESVNSTHNSGDLFPVGTTIITYTASDANANSISANFNIIVLDTISPVIENLPTDITQNTDAGACGAIVNWTLPTASDNCSATLSSSHNPGDLFPVGTTTVTYTANDIHGNSTVQTFDVTISDNIPPAIANIPADITQNTDAGACGAIVSWTLPTASDNCSVTLSSSHNSGVLFPVGTTTVTYTASDIHGNSTVQTFDVTISDNIPPAIANIPADITQDTDAGACGAIVSWTAPTATDNCSATISSSHNPGDFFDVGNTIVSYIASDGHGNTFEAEFEITIIDRSAPEFTNCPLSYNILSVDTENNKTSISWELPVANDPCSAVTLTSNFNPGDAFDLGSTEVVYTARDESGNEATCSFVVEGYMNISPLSDNPVIYTKAGESVDICLNASDPNDDHIVIKEIQHENSLASISDIDEERLCFLYSSDIDFYGRDTVTVILTDDGLPPMTTTAIIIIDVERNINIEVNDVVTINGDQINDSWFIKNIDQYPGNSVRVFDRWGGLIFQSTGYNNNEVVWNGESNSSLMYSDKYVSTGTYFYAIDLGNGSKSITGAIEVIR